MSTTPFTEEALADWLSDIAGTRGPLSLTRIGAGQSNLTYLATDGDGTEVVVRRPPLGHLAASAHDVAREGHIMASLADTPVPVPEIFGTTDPDGSVGPLRVSDAPVVAMSVIPGTSLNSPDAAASISPEARSAAATGLIEAMVTIHEVDLVATGLDDLASHGPYAERQLRRWSNQWEKTKTRELPALDALTERLRAAVPEQTETVLVHGDLHLGNIIVDKETGNVNAVVDWELTTLGDPLADIGSLLAYWPTQDGPNLPGFDAALEPGFPDAEELAQHYLSRTGRSRDALDFWHVLGLWKVAVIVEGVVRRTRDVPANASSGMALPASVVEVLVDQATVLADQVGI
ncbi:Putative aminoglycoside phosphotransferase [Corynebacterium glyciniphilum AJ 3170]|uniref:Putative aminoglycoside phosphotransferase n=1 Tax=Corynebacterium glyciniphilum AJ 3170 TaxID=1404245 RepID=X5DXC7_9CORY|nr:phosphotransferase family protein [Corynebacterium glyciniphilum]AHW65252.1 Putative aminoglycoside phosphotransferase [Corynebacterium glyciniphilum AJ 3170]